MSSFEQRKAEVLRRSEERIKEKKRKTRAIVAATVTPLVLCAFFAGAYFDTVMSPAHEQDAPPTASRGEMDNLSTDRRYPEGTEKADDTKGAGGETKVPETEGSILEGDTAGTIKPADTEIVIIPADSEVSSADTKEPASTSAPENTGRYGVRLETYVNLPGGLASVTINEKVIKESTSLIHTLTNGEASLYSWGIASNVPSISTTIPESLFKVKITDNFGLSWEYEVTENCIIYIGTKKAYPITEDQFESLINALNIYLPQ